MILANEPNIREVIPVPKTGDARDLMMGAPSPMPKKALDEANIQVKKFKVIPSEDCLPHVIRARRVRRAEPRDSF